MTRKVGFAFFVLALVACMAAAGFLVNRSNHLESTNAIQAAPARIVVDSPLNWTATPGLKISRDDMISRRSSYSRH